MFEYFSLSLSENDDKNFSPASDIHELLAKVTLLTKVQPLIQ